MADLIDKSVNMTAAMLVFALVAVPVGFTLYYDKLANMTGTGGPLEGAPTGVTTILDYLPVILTAAIAFGAFKRFR